MSLSPEELWDRVLEVRDVLMYTFDVEVLDRPLSLEEYARENPGLPAFAVPDAGVTAVARSGLGAVYARWKAGQEAGFLYIDARGAVVRLDRELRDVLALVVALPYWPELVELGAPGELAMMREQAERLEREVCDDLYALPAARQELLSFLELPVVADPVRHLHELAAQPPPVVVQNIHGWLSESPDSSAHQGASG
jgi:hypothetical protein